MAHSGTIIYMRNVPGFPKLLALTKPLACEMWDGSIHYIQPPFSWNGNSSGIFTPVFPKWNHPIASCKHDYRCGLAKNAQERTWSDSEFKKDVRTTGWWITAELGYIGVRTGALLGIGSSF